MVAGCAQQAMQRGSLLGRVELCASKNLTNASWQISPPRKAQQRGEDVFVYALFG